MYNGTQSEEVDSVPSDPIRSDPIRFQKFWYVTSKFYSRMNTQLLAKREFSHNPQWDEVDMAFLMARIDTQKWWKGNLGGKIKLTEGPTWLQGYSCIPYVFYFLGLCTSYPLLVFVALWVWTCILLFFIICHLSQNYLRWHVTRTLVPFQNIKNSMLSCDLRIL